MKVCPFLVMHWTTLVGCIRSCTRTEREAGVWPCLEGWLLRQGIPYRTRKGAWNSYSECDYIHAPKKNPGKRDLLHIRSVGDCAGVGLMIYFWDQSKEVWCKILGGKEQVGSMSHHFPGVCMPTSHTPRKQDYPRYTAWFIRVKGLLIEETLVWLFKAFK